jgi:hypothetical protein
MARFGMTDKTQKWYFLCSDIPQEFEIKSFNSKLKFQSELARQLPQLYEKMLVSALLYICM